MGKARIWPVGAVAVVALLGFAGLSITSPRVHADDGDSTVQLGFALPPVPLNLNGLDPSLVGKGSYIVNAKGDCAGCHNSPDLGTQWAAGHNPFFGQPKMINPASYLGGGTRFGPFPGEEPGGTGTQMFIYSRNLTPDKSGLPEGGTTLSNFLTIFRTGHGFDNAHPACPSLGVEGCLSTTVPGSPYDASLLQVMPWPIYGNMSDDDLHAVWEYLRAIPCISHAGTAGLPPNIYQSCP